LLAQFTASSTCIYAVHNKSQQKCDEESNSQKIALSGLVDDDVARSAQVARDDLLEKTVCARHPDLVETVVGPVEIVGQPINRNACRHDRPLQLQRNEYTRK